METPDLWQDAAIGVMPRSSLKKKLMMDACRGVRPVHYVLYQSFSLLHGPRSGTASLRLPEGSRLFQLRISKEGAQVPSRMWCSRRIENREDTRTKVTEFTLVGELLVHETREIGM